MNKKANHPVQTTEKSLKLIKRLQEVDGARIQDLEGYQGMTKGTIHNHLSTLREQGFVVKNGREYQLSMWFLTLGGGIRNRNSLYQAGRAKVQQLAEDTGMLANLMTEEDGKGVYLYQAEGNYAVDLDTHVGYRIHLHNTGIGKAILAFFSHERVIGIAERWGLPRTTENTITNQTELMEELETIRNRGYAIDHEERTEGLACIAAPVRLDEQVLGAISISAPTQRLGNEEFDEEIIREVESTANEVSLAIKYN